MGHWREDHSLINKNMMVLVWINGLIYVWCLIKLKEGSKYSDCLVLY